jgi:hypothetical protein
MSTAQYINGGASLSRSRQDLLTPKIGHSSTTHFLIYSNLSVDFNISIMRLSVALFSNFLFATTILAAPSGSAEQVSQREDRLSNAGFGRRILASKRANPIHERQGLSEL